MRSLNAKLVLAFVVVSLVGVIVVAGVVGGRTAARFDAYMRDRWVAFAYDRATQYYQQNGTWVGLQETLLAGEFYAVEPRPGRMPAMMPPQAAPAADPRDSAWLIVLVDREGRALIRGLDYEVGEEVPERLVRSGTPLMVNGVQVGTLIARPDQRRRLVDIWQHAFLGDFMRALLLGAGGAVALALLVGVMLAHSISRPVRELTAATQAMSRGTLVHKIPVRSQDELGMLAESFNQMSDDLAKAETQRKQMTADIAHELRTPLSLILGHAEALCDSVLPPSIDTFEIIHDEAQRLTRLVEELRTLSLSDAGELALNLEPVLPNALLERAMAVHAPLAYARQIAVLLDAGEPLPVVLVDTHRMAQVLDNLLTNALHFTPAGGTIRLIAKSSDNLVRLAIEDSGPGIAQDELGRVFDRFYRGDKARHRQEGGSGLGLAIARSIIENHRGHLWAESPPGQGARFVIELPAAG